MALSHDELWKMKFLKRFNATKDNHPNFQQEAISLEMIRKEPPLRLRFVFSAKTPEGLLRYEVEQTEGCEVLNVTRAWWHDGNDWVLCQ